MQRQRLLQLLEQPPVRDIVARPSICAGLTLWLEPETSVKFL